MRQRTYRTPLRSGDVSPLDDEARGRGAGAQVAPQDERRRGQRVTIRMAVKLHFEVRGEISIVDGVTWNVNDHGALLISPRNLQTGTRFTLENSRTREKIACRVTRSPQSTADGYQIPVEFDHPAPGFWHIAFPPTDWKAGEE